MVERTTQTTFNVYASPAIPARQGKRTATMRDYGKVYSTFWSSETTADLCDDSKLLAIYLMTCPHSTIAGVFRLPDGYVSEDLGWDLKRVQKGFVELLAKGFANRCESTKWVWVCKHLEWNKPENPNQRKSAAKIALSVPDGCVWKPDFMRVCGEQLEISWTPPDNPCATLSEGLLNQKQEQEQEQEQDTPIAPRGADLFAEFWSAYPKKIGKDAAAKAFGRRKPGRELLQNMLDAIDAQKLSDQWRRDGGQYIPNPATWLNQGRWQDGEALEDQRQETFV
jgi:hypothetical protein